MPLHYFAIDCFLPLIAIACLFASALMPLFPFATKLSPLITMASLLMPLIALY
jgi:hypothetical protein